ncbi:LuxR C-terminal-related transcriptional regulator [Nocardioides sp. Iso805N]|uniref:LuxR C-terminal-related transcriptional regulator n=1 Tax=Nocardioides sp. Iso805N TaxID=1283287 RepID=UPI00037E795C|nr:LuxR C-terminal-related transcriptional regulator [Nocardioides sp. Iso805N]
MGHQADGSTPAQRGRYDTPFFGSKFRVPRAPGHFVRRPRLVQVLDALADYPVTALVAPAGAGKTALAADWVRRTGRRAAWLALDDTDRAAHQLTTALAAAVDQLDPGVATTALAMLRGPHEPGDAVRALVEALEDLDADPAVLVVDDVHLVDDDEEAASCLASFVEHTPAWLSVLLLSRRQLVLPIDRLRAGGVLADLDFEALRFSPAEATEMLTALCPEVAAEDLPQLTLWAGGWAAALQLAALAMRTQRTAAVPLPRAGPDPSTRSDRLVDTYLWREVLRAERPEVIDLLLDVSVVDRVNYPLAEALGDRADAGDILMEAERRGLFVTSLESGGWFEVHELVKDMLLAELERRWPQRLRRQHARAARWFETADDSSSALEHWLAAGMHREALRLLADLAVELFESGRSSQIRRVIDQIQPVPAGSDADAFVEYAWCQLLADGPSVDAALAAAEGAAAASVDDVKPGRLLVLQAASALSRGDWHRCEELARLAVLQAPESPWLDPLGRMAWTLMAHGIALDERWLDGAPEVGAIVRGISHDTQRLIALEGTRAVGLALAGQPLDALRTSAGVRRLAAAGEMRTLHAELCLADAVALRELGDGEQARQLLDELSTTASVSHVFVRLVAQLELVELYLSIGDVDSADRAFRQAVETSERRHPGRGGTSWVARRGVQLEVARGDLDAAAQWSQLVEDPFWRPVGEARVSLCRQQVARADESLIAAVPRCARHQVIRHLMQARVLVGERDAAEKKVAAAVETATEHGMLETVGSEGRELLDILELAAWRVPDGWMDRLRHVVIGRGTLRPHPGALVDELTARELDVLRLLPTRLTVREIADELFVSHNTLKFHVRVIYQKLGVNSRAEAVEAARRLDLMRGP